MALKTLVGWYSIKTDIFSLGVVLAFVLQGKHPWADYISSEVNVPMPALVRQFRENEPSLALKLIVAKAIAAKPSERYKSIEDFGAALGKYIGNENLNGVECSGPAHSSLLQYYLKARHKRNLMK